MIISISRRCPAIRAAAPKQECAGEFQGAVQSAFCALPASLAAEQQGDVAILRLKRPHKRNALDDETIIGIETFFTSLPDGIGAVLLAGEGDIFPPAST